MFGELGASSGAVMRFAPDFLKTLDQLRFATRRSLAGGGRGDRRGRHRGRGLEFADYRPYAQGDDFRHIDWKAYRRLGRLLVRLFDEEQDLRVYLFVDASRSMARHGKFEHAVRLAAALAYIGVARLDRVTVFPFTDRLGAETTSGHARSTLARVLAVLETLEADGGTDMWRAVEDFCRQPRRPGVAVVVSDFLDPRGVERPLALLSARGHDVVALHVLSGRDRDEAAVEHDGDVVLVDAETGEERKVTLTPALLAAHGQAWLEFARAVETACQRSRAQYVQIDPDVPVETTLLHTFRTGRFLE